MKINFWYLTLLTSFLILTIPRSEAQSWYKISNSIDLIMGMDLGFRIIKAPNTSQLANFEYQNRSEFESYKINYRIGLNYVHGISKRFSIKTGARFSNPGFSILGIEDIDPNQNINTIEKQLGTSQTASEFKYGYQLIEMPLGLRYTLTKNTCEPFFELGVSSNFYWRTMVRKKRHNQRGFSKAIVNEKQIKKLNYIGFFSMGGNINLTKHFSAYSQLIARYQFNSLRESEVVEKIISLGLEFGIRRYLD